MRHALIKGYADQLQTALGQSPTEITAATVLYAKLPIAEMSQQIRAALRKEDLGKQIAPKAGPTSHDALFYEAVCCCEKLGRAVLLADINLLQKTHGGSPEGWAALQTDYRQRLFPALERRCGRASNTGA